MEASHQLKHDYYIRHLASKYFQRRFSHYQFLHVVIKFMTFTAFVAVYSNNEKSAKFSYVYRGYCALSLSGFCDAVRRKHAV